MIPFFVVTWPPNLSSSDLFKGISGPDPDEKLAPNIIDKYRDARARKALYHVGCSHHLAADSSPCDTKHTIAPLLRPSLVKRGRISVKEHRCGGNHVGGELLLRCLGPLPL